MKKRKNWLLKEDSEDLRKIALNFSLKYLSIRGRSVKEVYDYLRRKNFIEDTINSVLKQLIDLKFLNDQDFASQWIESRQRNKNKSKYILKNELRLKGVSGDVIESLLSEAADDYETAKVLFEKKKKTYSNLSKMDFKKKMSSFLQRRGYSWEIISKLLRDSKF